MIRRLKCIPKLVKRLSRGLLAAVALWVAIQFVIALAEYFDYPWRDYNVVAVYLTTVLWCVMAFWALIECAIEEGADERELKKVTKRDLILLIPAARNSNTRARLMTNQAVMKILAGIAAALFLYYVPPDQDMSPLQLSLRLFFMLDIYWFIRAKRTDRARRRNTQTERG